MGIDKEKTITIEQEEDDKNKFLAKTKAVHKADALIALGEVIREKVITEDMETVNSLCDAVKSTLKDIEDISMMSEFIN